MELPYLAFLDPSADPSQALQIEYDPLLVALSFLVAALASYSALATADRMANVRERRWRWGWLAVGAVVMGTGVWAMHFIGMLAARIPLPVRYDLFVTGLSLPPAVVAGLVCLVVISRPRIGTVQLVGAGTAMGAGIGTMHYVGMAAMRLDASMRYEPVSFLLSIVVAVVLANLALYMRFLARQVHAEGLGTWIASAALMGGAITAMHYTGMWSVHFFPTESTHVQAPGLGIESLAALVAIVTAGLMGTVVIATVAARRLQLATAEAQVNRLQLLEAVESIPEGFILLDADRRIVVCNSTYEEMQTQVGTCSGRQVLCEQIFSALPDAPTSPDDASDGIEGDQIEARMPTAQLREELLKDGRWVQVRERETRSGRLVSVWTDITEQKRLQESLQQMANHDPLTGLPNRNLFWDRLRVAAARARRTGGRVVLLYIDLDHFKDINDTLGHNVGDAVLKSIAQRLVVSLREVDAVARLGGDEFAVILETGNDDGWRGVAERIVTVLPTPMRIGEHICCVGGSIGVSTYPTDSEDIQDLVKMADAAMYEVKAAGRGGFREYETP